MPPVPLGGPANWNPIGGKPLPPPNLGAGAPLGAGGLWPGGPGPNTPPLAPGPPKNSRAPPENKGPGNPRAPPGPQKIPPPGATKGGGPRFFGPGPPGGPKIFFWEGKKKIPPLFPPFPLGGPPNSQKVIGCPLPHPPFSGGVLPKFPKTQGGGPKKMGNQGVPPPRPKNLNPGGGPTPREKGPKKITPGDQRGAGSPHRKNFPPPFWGGNGGGGKQPPP